MKTAYILLIPVLFWMPGTASGEAPEKVKKTIDFIVQKTTIQRRCGIEYCFQKLSFSKSGCDITANQVYSEERFGKTKFVFTGKANCKTLNPNRIEIEENEIRLHTTAGAKTVFISRNEESEMSSILYVFTDAVEDAGDVAKAFKFLIEVCGGQEGF